MASIHRAIPQILVNDLGAALSYYQERLGFTCDFAYEDFYASISRDGASITGPMSVARSSGLPMRSSSM